MFVSRKNSTVQTPSKWLSAIIYQLLAFRLLNWLTADGRQPKAPICSTPRRVPSCSKSNRNYAETNTAVNSSLTVQNQGDGKPFTGPEPKINRMAAETTVVTWYHQL